MVGTMLLCAVVGGTVLTSERIATHGSSDAVVPVVARDGSALSAFEFLYLFIAVRG